MIESPINIDFPWSTGIFCMVCAAAMFYGLVVFKRRRKMHSIVMYGLRLFYHRWPDDRLEIMPKIYFGGMALLFGTMGLFCLAIGSGVLRNRPWTQEDTMRAIQQFEEEHGHLPRRRPVEPGQ